VLSKKVLIVDDEQMLVKGIKFSLEREGYLVEAAYDGEACLEKLKKDSYDIIILDLMLPNIDGLTLCRKIRETSNIPIIMLTAKGEDVDKIIGLELGADDYMTKPFNIRELIARVKAIFRRMEHSVSNEEIIKVGELTIDRKMRRVVINGEEVELTGKEYDLLLLLVTNPGRVYTRENLLERIWGFDFYGGIRTVDVHVSRLREKIERNVKNPEYILTKWGVGYYFREQE
jgi:DNA-binding response OmpR family regulator